MNTAIIIELSNIYNIRIVKTIFSGEKNLSDQYVEMIHQHLRSVPEVIEKEGGFVAIPGFENAFPMLPLYNKSSFTADYHDKYGHWRIILI